MSHTLMENERVLVFCRGIMGPDAGLVVLTDKRTMFLFRGHTSEKLTSIPIMKINSLSVETGRTSTSGQIVINEGSSSITITKMEKKAVSYLVKKYQELAYKLDEAVV